MNSDILRNSSRWLGSVVIVAGLGLVVPAGVVPAGAVPSHRGFVPGPINAANTFKWGDPAWRDEWEPDVDTPRAIEPFWSVAGPGVVQVQHGMMTLNTTDHGSVSATLDRPGHRVGRWEIRLRSRRYATAGTNFQVLTELVPAGRRPQHCGARNVSLESYRIGAHRVRLFSRTLPRRAYTAKLPISLHDDQWHTFAVELTHHRVSWFVDSRVVVTERRAAALSHTRMTLRFTLKATAGRSMNLSRMQMDWARYFTLDRPNQKSVDARHARAGRYGRAC